jgi:FtsH-binding integral membrane protein
MNRSRDLVRIRALLMGAFIGGLGLMVVGIYLMMTSYEDNGALGGVLSIIGVIFFYGLLLRAARE